MSRKPLGFFIALILLFRGGALNAQDDLAVFREAAGNSSMLYRGRRALDYRFPYNGTYYWYNPEFHPGRVCYNTKVYTCDAINIDAHIQELIVKNTSGVISIMPNRSFVEWFEIGDTKYLNAQVVCGPDSPEGLFEVIYEGRAKVLMQIKKPLVKDVNPQLLDLGAYPAPFKQGILEVFVPETKYYYVDENGKFSRIRTRGDLYKHYSKPQKKAMKKYISTIETDEALMPLATVCERALDYIEHTAL